MRPVDKRFPISQLFAGLATRGVVGRPNGSEVEYLVWLYGDYQPYGHAGVDIACPVGTPIRAMNAGTVVYAGWGEDLPGDDSWGPSGYFRRWGMYKNFPGIVTVIKHRGANKFDIYGHQSDNEAVRVGMTVEEGQLIGLSGDTKTRTQKVGPHLHVVTVADPVNYATDWPRLIFGCEDPTPYFGSTGLVLQGAITNAATQFQEDDMFTDADRELLGKIGSEATNAKNNAKWSAEEAQLSGRIAQAALQAINGLLHTQLVNPLDPEGYRPTVAEWLVYTNVKADAALQGVTKINPEDLAAAVAKASASAPVAINLEDLAASLQITPKEAGK